MSKINKNTITIGDVVLANPVALAPMAGVCDSTYRMLAKEQGVGLVCSEMVSAKGLMYGSDRTKEMLRIHPSEHPISIQLFGREPDIMANAAQEVAAMGADIIDINMGCPVAKIVRNGEGSALLRDIPAATAVISAMVRAVSIPITVKMRIGWDTTPYDYVGAARAFADAGAAALTVHGRTRMQMYSGRANWQAIAEIVSAVDIPVWGNGDVVDGPSARSMMNQTGCAGVAIGRAAQGNPFVFKEVVHYLATGETLPTVTKQERIDMCLRHLHNLAAEKGEYIAVREMRTHAIGYLKGMAGAAAKRRELTALTTLREWDSALRDMMERD